jgi:uncharacterized protein YjiS (DUF1127 family)
MAYVNTTTTLTPGFTARVTRGFEALATRIRQRRLYRETFNSLNALTNRELNDLGLNRGDLHRVSWDSSRG